MLSQNRESPPENTIRELKMNQSKTTPVKGVGRGEVMVQGLLLTT